MKIEQGSFQALIYIRHGKSKYTFLLVNRNISVSCTFRHYSFFPLLILFTSSMNPHAAFNHSRYWKNCAYTQLQFLETHSRVPSPPISPGEFFYVGGLLELYNSEFLIRLQLEHFVSRMCVCVCARLWLFLCGGPKWVRGPQYVFFEEGVTDWASCFCSDPMTWLALKEAVMLAVTPRKDCCHGHKTP